MFNKLIIRGFACAICLLSLHHAALAQQSTASINQSRLSNLFSNTKEEELLEPEQAFKMKVLVKGPTTLVAELAPASGYYLYKDKIRFAVKDASGVAIKSIKLPNGLVKNDPSFGRMETYTQPIQAEITLDRPSKTKNFTLTAAYQGCHEKLGVCYPPIDKAVTVTLP